MSHLEDIQLIFDILLGYWYDIGRNEVFPCDLSIVIDVPYIPWDWECVWLIVHHR